MTEVDAMICRVCGKEERASEGYPCENCGDFICLICSFDGITLCKSCAERASAPAAAKTENAADQTEAAEPAAEAEADARGESDTVDPNAASAANDGDDGPEDVT